MSLEALNHAVPFILAITLAVVALAHVFAYLAQMAGLSGVSKFFSFQS